MTPARALRGSVMRILVVVLAAVVGAVLSGSAAARTTQPSTVHVTKLPLAGANLYGVSCPSTKLCFAVGAVLTIGASGPESSGLIERFNGHSWSTSLRLPDTVSSLQGVSCVSTSFCLAVGYEGPYPAPTVALRWNGHSWSRVPSASPPSAAEGDSLSGVDCLSQRDCWAVGATNIDDIGGPPVSDSLIEHFDGSALQTVTAPDNALGAVSCASAASCYAVGGPPEYLQGSDWRVSPHPAALNRGPETVTCRTSATCWILGAPGKNNALDPFRVVGGTFQRAPVQPTSFGVIPNGSDCASADDCWVVGSALGGVTPMVTVAPLAEQWDGSRWVAARTQSAYRGDAQLTSVSCTPNGQCVAVGGSVADAQMTALVAVIEPGH
jgi:hypothetical protein